MKLSLRAGLAALFLAASLNAACKKADNATPAADSSTTMAPAPAALAVVSVDLGRSVDAERRVIAVINEFGTRDTIFASVATTGSGTGTLAAHWTFEDGQTVEQSEQNVSASGPAVTEFHIAKPTAWPAGKYKVVITLNGQEVGNQEFDVK